ncbi:MAG: hypothetical protein E4G71_04775 [Candidatus Atribacteria bacterium]|nr:MAG: hypothetical protein E4G71_04775 [Candidatus Atribacteria bacterium]
MNCNKIIKLLNPYIDQTLDAESTQTVEEHLKSCPTCQDEYLRLKEMVASLNFLPQVSAPQNLTQIIMAKISQEDVQIQSSWIDQVKRRISFPRLSFRLVGGAAAAALVMFFAVTFIFNTPDTSPICSAEVQFSLRISDNKTHTVAIAGDFNGWDPQADTLKDPEGDGIWTGTLKLEPGRYEYMFVMDGEKWFPDPNALRYVKDGFGNKNAILEINNCNTT